MKNNKNLILILIIFFIISINSIYSFSIYLTKDTYSLVIRQILFYLVGAITIIALLKTKPETIKKYSTLIYIINVISLILVLLVGTEVNGSKAWFTLPLIGTLQPSEFMKIGLILQIAKIIDNQKIETTKDELHLLSKIAIITIIPSIITFLEPDTGAVLIYLIIAFVMLFTSKLRLRWFIILFSFLIIAISLLFYIYIFQTELFIKIFGSSMFYRFDRIFDWNNKSGIQLENSVISIGSSGLFGKGIANILLYFPEGHTDFIFSSFSSIYGLTGILILIISITCFDIIILKTKTNKAVISGIAGALIYQQIQNISMTIGLLPITGITLPFISYGGSSLISYMILLGIIMSIRANRKTTNKNI